MVLRNYVCMIFFQAALGQVAPQPLWNGILLVTVQSWIFIVHTDVREHLIDSAMLKAHQIAKFGLVMA